jgi:NAD-dependent dihydropyrimidine dehydrogenase PreA subunit
MIVIDCPERIACDVCAAVCARGVIAIGDPITNRPTLNDEENCAQCGLCVAGCPGQAIFLVGESDAEGRCQVTLPYELSEDIVSQRFLQAVDNLGRSIGSAKLIRIRRDLKFNKTSLLEISVSQKVAAAVRGIRCHGK